MNEFQIHTMTRNEMFLNYLGSFVRRQLALSVFKIVGESCR